MPYLNVLTANDMVEGIVASVFIVITYHVLRDKYKFSKPMATLYGWFITWTLRKLSVNIYEFVHQHHGFTIPPVRMYI
jgi:hypothetical protein